MVERRQKRPRDPLALAKLVGDIATGQVRDEIEDTRTDAQKAAAVLGRMGGIKGGKARAAKMTKAKRTAAAKKAARARWHGD